MSKEKEITKAEMIEYITEINRRLKQDNRHGELILVGGAALTIAFGARESTYDIDAIFNPIGDIARIVSDIAVDYSLHTDWLNNAAKGYVTEAMNQEVLFDMSNLTVYNVDAQGLLAMKLTAAREMTKDLDDSVFLMEKLNIENKEQLHDIVKSFARQSLWTERAQEFTVEAFEKYQERVKNNKTHE